MSLKTELTHTGSKNLLPQTTPGNATAEPAINSPKLGAKSYQTGASIIGSFIYGSHSGALSGKKRESEGLSLTVKTLAYLGSLAL